MLKLRQYPMSRSVQVGRLTRMVTFTFGASVAVLMGGIYLAGYALKR